MAEIRSRSRSRDFPGEGEDVRFIDPRGGIEEPPYRAIALAVLLLVIGTFFLTAGGVKMFRRTTGDGGADIAFLVLGSLTFLPGFYITRIAYYKWRGVPGYSYADIPQ